MKIYTVVKVVDSDIQNTHLRIYNTFAAAREYIAFNLDTADGLLDIDTGWYVRAVPDDWGNVVEFTIEEHEIELKIA